MRSTQGGGEGRGDHEREGGDNTGIEHGRERGRDRA